MYVVARDPKTPEVDQSRQKDASVARLEVFETSLITITLQKVPPKTSELRSKN